MPRASATRRSISVKSDTYERLRVHCAAQGISISSFVEEIVANKVPGAREEIKVPKGPKVPKAPGAQEEIKIPKHWQSKIRGYELPKALSAPISEVQMPESTGPLPGYIPPCQRW